MCSNGCSSPSRETTRSGNWTEPSSSLWGALRRRLWRFGPRRRERWGLQRRALVPSCRKSFRSSGNHIGGRWDHSCSRFPQGWMNSERCLKRSWVPRVDVVRPSIAGVAEPRGEPGEAVMVARGGGIESGGQRAWASAKAASKARPEGVKPMRRLTNSAASAAPYSRSIPASSHSTESGPL